MKGKLKETKEKGEHVSPVLPDEVKNYLIDIDGTVCDDIPNEQPERMRTANVYPGAVNQVNTWYDEGHVITFFSSRTEEHRDVTSQWLKSKGFKYHNLLLGKPRGGNYHWIDNHEVKATRYEGKFTEMVLKKKAIHVFKD